MDLDAILAKAGAAPPPAADDEQPSFLTKKPKGMDLDSILRKAGAHPDDEEPAPSVNRTFEPTGSLADIQAGLKAQAPPTVGQQAKAILVDPFVDLGKGALAANRFAANAITNPSSVANLPTLREGMRGVNDNIPFANRAVQAMGGPPAESPEDAEAAPGARAFGGYAGIPVSSMVGSIAAKGVERAAPVVTQALQSIGDRAQNIQAERAAAQLEVKTTKGVRAGLRSDAVKAATADYPELRRAAAAGNDAKVAEVTAAMKQKAQSTLAPIYERAGPADEAVAKAIGNADERITQLAAGDVNQRAAAVKLSKLRDEFNNSFGPRETTTAAELRAEQSAYQKNGYAKNIAGDPEVSASILAQREMSKAVGDAVIEHVTGMDYAAAKAKAAVQPDGLAARIFKANQDIEAANKIDASITGRADRPAPKAGLAKLAHNIKHPLDFAVDSAMGAPAAAGNKVVDAAARLADLRAGRLGAPTGETPSFAAPPVQPQRPTPGQAAAVARLLQAARQGATRQQLQAQAQQDGTPPELAANIAMQFGR